MVRDLPQPTVPRDEPNFDALRLAAHIRRRQLRLSVRALAERSQVPESTVTGALYGYSEGNLRTWHAMAKGLQVPLGALLNHLNDP